MKSRLLLFFGVPLLFGLAAFELNSGLIGGMWFALTSSEPTLECPASIDLGERERGEVAVSRFSVRNNGGKELLIDQLRPNCSCTGFEEEIDGRFVRLESVRVAPNETVNLVVRLSVQARSGTAARNVITFRTNDPARPKAGIEFLITKVTGGLVSVPAAVVFGSVLAGREARHIVDVYDTAAEPRTIDKVSCSNPDVVVKRLPISSGINPTVDESPGHLVSRLELVAKTNRAGLIDAQVEVHLTGSKGPPALIPVTGRIVNKVEVTPSILVLPKASAAGPIYSAKAICRSTEDKPLTVTIASLPKGVSVVVLPSANDATSRIVQVEWNPNADDDLDVETTRTLSLRAQVDSVDMPLEIQLTCIRKAGD